MLTRNFFPILAIAAAGSIVLACGSPDRIFIEVDSGSPPSDSSSRTDAGPDAVTAADQQNDVGMNTDGAVADAPPPETSTDAGVDAASDPRVDAAPDGGAPDIVVNDAPVGDTAVNDTAVNDATGSDAVTSDTVASDTATSDTVTSDTVTSDSAPDMGTPTDGGWTPDAGPDVLDCSGTSPPRITPSGNVSLCPGSSMTLTSSPAVSYLWSTAQTTQAISVNAAGSYTVTTTDTRGCVASSTPTVVSMYPTPPPTITANGPTRFCTGQSVTLSTASAPSYLWSTGETTQSIVVSANGNYYVTTTDPYGCGISMTSAPTAVTVVTPTTGSRTFSFVGAAETFTVPECVTSVVVDAYGAQGGSSNSAGVGGYGGEVYARVYVTAGSTIQIRVGGSGVLCTVDNSGGWNGGGSAACTGTGGTYSATGGGATDIRVSPYGLDDRVLVVGGGGGGGYNCGSVQDSGGVGGGTVGGMYPTTCGGHPESAGGGGSQTSGGLGGTYPGWGYSGNGQYGVGGSGVSPMGALEGGGGGGGYFGGGGGCWVGGGGGSDYLRATVTSLFGQWPGTQPGHGVVYLYW